MAQPPLSVLGKIRKCRWTSHNIPLTASESTLGSDHPLIGDDARTRVIKNQLKIFSRDRGYLSGMRLIDLGCLEGGLSLEMAREGMDVLGVEGREENHRKCRLIDDYFSLPNLRFLHLDVKFLSKEAGVFDAVLCCGLLYHLDDPIQFLALLQDITHEASILFLDTHIAPLDESALEICRYKSSLSGLVQLANAGVTYEGRWFEEYSEEAVEPAHPWTAVSNYRSFWLTQDSLIQALYNTGFRSVYMLYGMFNIEQEFMLRREYSRLYCIALRGPEE